MTLLYGPAFLDGSSIGPFELLIILGVSLMLFGPERLPEMARKFGRIMAQFRHATDDLKGQLMRMDVDPADEPPHQISKDAHLTQARTKAAPTILIDDGKPVFDVESKPASDAPSTEGATPPEGTPGGVPE